MIGKGVVEKSSLKIKTSKVVRAKQTTPLPTPRLEILPSPILKPTSPASKLALKLKRKLVLPEDSPIEDPKLDVGKDAPIVSMIKKRKKTQRRSTKTPIVAIPISMVSFSPTKQAASKTPSSPKDVDSRALLLIE